MAVYHLPRFKVAGTGHTYVTKTVGAPWKALPARQAVPRAVLSVASSRGKDACITATGRASESARGG